MSSSLNHDLNKGGGYGTLKPDPAVKSKVGYRLAQFFDIEPDDLSDLDDELDHEGVIDLNRKIGNVPRKTIHYDRVDRATLTNNQRFMPEATHKNTARSGMSPFKYPKPMGHIGSGGSDQAFRTTGNFRPTGTLLGTSHAPMKTDNLGPPGVVEDPMERSFLEQQRKIKKIFEKIKNSLG